MDFTTGQRLLKKNHRQSYPARVLFVDTETNQAASGPYTHHSFRMGWTRFVRLDSEINLISDKWCYWEDKYALCRYIKDCCHDKTATWIITHNAFFDLQVIGFFTLFTYWNWQLEFIYDKGLSFILIIHKDKKTIKVISSTNYFDYSLKQIGEEIDLPKLDIDFGEATLPELKTYCHRDVEILSRAVLEYMRFNKAHDTGNFSLTRASQCFTAFRHRFMESKIYIHRNKAVQQLERAAYFGGRTECFRFGKVPGNDFVSIDVNSMYPFVMKKYRLPTRLVDYYENPGYDRYERCKDSTCQVAKVRVVTDAPWYGVRRNGKLIFPVGEFDCYLSTGGLACAFVNNHLIDIYQMAVYQCQFIFSEYVDYWYDLKVQYKRAGNKSYTRITKIFLNALYGKFGMKKPIEDMIDAPDNVLPYRINNIDLETGLTWIEFCIFNKAIRQFGEMETATSFVAIPAHITEYARLYLYDLINRLAAGSVYYCDTDSLFIARKDLSVYNDLLNQEKLGGLAIDKEFKSLVINGCKDYVLDGKRTVKGVPASAKLILDNTYKYDEFLGLKKHLAMEQSGEYFTREMIKVVPPKYDKGKVHPDGSISPWLLS